MCGLAGIIALKKKEYFNINEFNTLGILNDERGGDSCGTFIDGNVEYGINKDSYFRQFCIKQKYPKEFSIALLHCRKTSPGLTTGLKQAQPVIIYNKNKEVDYVLMHNGTITNAKELAKKYIPKFDVFGLSDSQIMARIMYETGYNVLDEYVGTAVFIIVDYREEKPLVLFFKGKSCYNELNSDSERPLYYMIKDDKLYFSSMFPSLYLIDSNVAIYHLPANELLYLENKEWFYIAKPKRHKLTKPVVVYNYSNSYGSSYSQSTYYQKDTIVYDTTTGLYNVNKKPITGKYNAFPSGFISSHNQALTDYYFYNGRLLYNKRCFDFLTSLEDLFSEDDLIICSEVIDYFAYNPFIINGKYKVVNESFTYTTPDFEHKWYSLFGSGEYIYRNNTVSYKYTSPATAVEEFSKVNIHFNFNQLEEDVINFIAERLSTIENECV